MTQAAQLAQYGASSVGLSFKNRIINGAMVIDQRNAGAIYTPTGGAITYGSVDRWQFAASQASKFTVQRNSGSVTPPTGFTNYLGAVSLSAYSVTGSEQFNITQAIEGFNTADLGFGTASASTVTLSFWVRSSLTGTFGGVLSNDGKTRTYPFTYTITSANTWEYKTITVTGDTSGTWNTSNSTGLFVTFGLGVGSSASAAAGAWTGTANIFGATGATSVVGTNGATFYITGVQLEVGSTATSFDYRPYGTELALCQRYFEKSYSQSTAVGTASASNGYDSGGCATIAGYLINSTIQFKNTKRATPTITVWDNRNPVTQGNVETQASGGATTSRAAPTNSILDTGFNFIILTTDNRINSCNWAASAEL